MEKNWELVKNEDLKKHKIMDIWAKMNYSDDYAFHISKCISSRMSLDDLADEL